MRTALTLLCLATSLMLMSCSVTPRHDIKPRPDFIHAGVQVGDTVEIVTDDGREVTLIVSDVRSTSLAGESPHGVADIIDFADITNIAKRSWTEPAHPCGGGQPVGCSIPEVVLVLSEDYQRQADKFRGACATHDFCYRHGYATYGLDRSTCDDTFYDDMQASCSSMGALSILDPKEFGICQAAARQTFEAVRRYGEPHFRTTTSSVCDYR